MLEILMTIGFAFSFGVIFMRHLFTIGDHHGRGNEFKR